MKTKKFKAKWLVILAAVASVSAVGALLMTSAYSASSKNWTNTYGGVLHNPNGGMSLEEEKYFTTFNNQWSNNFVKQTSGDYLLETYKKNTGVANSGSLYKINAYGAVKAVQNTHFNAIYATKDGGYTGLGLTSKEKDSYNFSLSKYKKNGQLEWKKAIKQKSQGIVYLNLLTATGDGYAVGGWWYVKDIGHQAYIRMLSAKGDYKWDLVVAEGNESAIINSLQPTSEGGVVLSGYKTSLTDNSTTAFVTKVNSDGTKAWEETFGCDESAAFASEDKEGNILVASNVRAYAQPDKYLYYTKIMVISSDNGQMGEKAYQSLFSEDVLPEQCSEVAKSSLTSNPVAYKINMIRQLSDGGLLLVGTRSTGIMENKQVDQVWAKKINWLERTEEGESDAVWEKVFPAVKGGEYGMMGYEAGKDHYTVMSVKKNGQRVIRSFDAK